jgi:hypothetical protein
MKVEIIGRVIAIDYARQGFTIKPDNAQPVRVFACENVFTKLANRIENDRFAGKTGTRGNFTVSGKVLGGFKVTIKRQDNHKFKVFERQILRGLEYLKRNNIKFEPFKSYSIPVISGNESNPSEPKNLVPENLED